MIHVRNCDAKPRMIGSCMEKRKHGEMLSSTVRAIICDPSNCDKTNVLMILLESPNDIRFKNVYSKSLQQLKYQYFENLCLSTKSATLRSLITATSFHRARCAQILFLSLMTYGIWQAGYDERIFLDRHTNVSIRHKRGYLNIWYATTRIY